jgi:hypothetical protein
MNTNGALSHFASCGTRQIRAKLLRRVHRLGCVVLHTHIMPRRVAFFKPPPISPVSGSIPPSWAWGVANKDEERDMTVIRAVLFIGLELAYILQETAR